MSARLRPAEATSIGKSAACRSVSLVLAATPAQLVKSVNDHGQCLCGFRIAKKHARDPGSGGINASHYDKQHWLHDCKNELAAGYRKALRDQDRRPQGGNRLADMFATMKAKQPGVSDVCCLLFVVRSLPCMCVRVCVCCACDVLDSNLPLTP
jgi:hypothetical protein